MVTEASHRAYREPGARLKKRLVDLGVLGRQKLHKTQVSGRTILVCLDYYVLQKFHYARESRNEGMSYTSFS